MVTQKVKKSEIKSVSDLIHRFVNNQCPDIIKGNYEVYENQLYLHNQLVAYFYKKDTLIVKEFDRTGSFGNGYSHWSIKKAAAHLKVYVFSTLPSTDTLKDRKRFKNWYQRELEEHNKYFFDNISILKEYVTNKRLSRDLYLRPFELLHIPESLLKKYDKTINNIVIEKTIIGKLHSNSWGNNSYILCPEVKFKSKVKDIHTYSYLYLTEEELNIFRFKGWRNRYCVNRYKGRHSFRGTYEQDFKLFNNPVLKAEQEKRYEKSIEDEKKKKLEKEKNQIKTNYLKFLDGKIGFGSLYNLNFSMLRLMANTNVQTSLNVVINLDDAKRALALFRRYKDITEDKIITGVAIDGYVVSGIKLKDVQFPIYNKETDELFFETLHKHPCLIVGCHTIPYREVERFLTHENLNW